MGDYDHFGRATDALLRLLVFSLLVLAPLAIWKTIEIIIWLCSHVSINWN